MYYKITIDETGRTTLKDKPQRFNTEEIQVATLEEVKAALVDRYGKLPKRATRNTIFVGDGVPVGFLHSYWNADMSHSPVDRWYQTDWVTVTAVNEEPILVN